MPESDRGHSWLVKVLIVMLVFPTVLLAFMQVWQLALAPLAWLLPTGSPWAQLVGWTTAVVGLVFAVVATVWVCRLVWPRRAGGFDA